MGVLEYGEVDPRVAEVALALLEEGGEVDVGTRPGILLGRVLGDAREREEGVKRQLQNRTAPTTTGATATKLTVAVTEAAGEQRTSTTQ